MANPRLFPRMRGVALLLSIAATLSGCATAGVGRAAGPVGESEAVADRGPRVQIWTRDEAHADDRIGTSFRLEDDAYVVVVNVGRDGYANVIFPESPEDDGFMRGGRTYRLPAFFPGFPRHTRSEYRRLYSASASYDEVYDRYAGYVFVIASWRPMHFEVSEALGLWDSYRLATHEQRLDPYVVMHRFADQLVPGRSRDYTARFARYAAFNRGFAGRSSFASCSHYGSTFGAYPSWAYFGLVNAGWVPIYGYGHYDLGGAGCGTTFGLTVLGFRPRVRPGRAQPPAPVTPPVANPPGDTVGMPRTPPAVRSDSGERKPYPRPRSGGRPRTEVVADDDERIVDVTGESRRQVLRQEERELERARRALARERGYEPSDELRRSEGDRGRRDGESERVRARSSGDDNARVRAERPREESRPVERREAAPPRSEPRSEPRSAPRSEPRSEPRSQPEARSEPRAEPRGEKPKP